MSPDLAFLYPGQGTQRVGMGAWLARATPDFDDLCALFSDLLSVDLAALCRRGPEEALRETALAQAAIFAVSAAADALLRDRGHKPAVVAGHSLGEVTALYGAGMLDRDDAARLVAARGSLMATVPVRGAMAAVQGADEATMQRVLAEGGAHGRLSLGARNGPDQWVVSGDDAAVRAAVSAAEGVGCRTRPLATSAAFHSPLMEPIVAEWAAVVARAPLRDAAVPVVLNVDGTLTRSADVVRDALVRQMTAPVRWYECVGTVSASAGLAVECGDSKVLTALSRSVGLRTLSMTDPATLRRLGPFERPAVAP
jgi:[acyl-carrier-protein] S-malonyltransferase